MRGSYYVWNNYFPKNFIKRTENFILNCKLENGLVGGANGYDLNEDIRRSKTHLYNFSQTNYEMEREIALEMYKLARESNDYWQFNIDWRDFTIQLTYYEDNDEGTYDWHQDDNILQSGFYRKLSLAAVIKKCEEGGTFELDGGCLDFDQNEGSVIAFPSFMNHKVNPVTKGTRMSIVAWFSGNQWA